MYAIRSYYGYRQHAVRLVESLLHRIAVVGVDVDVGDTQPPLHGPLDGHHRIVEVTEAGSSAGVGMMPAAGHIEGGAAAAVDHLAHGFHGPAADETGPVVEPAEHP